MTETSIVGSFPTEGCDNEVAVVNRVLNTAQANGIQFQIAHDAYRPRCKIGSDEIGVTIVKILHNNEWKIWGREDFGRHRIHDPHTLGPVHAYNRPGPSCDRDYILSEENIEYCRDKYSIMMGMK